MPAENPLSNLKDIHLPPAVSFWPPAPGWWFLTILFVLLTFFCCRWLWRRHKRQRPKTDALLNLKTLQNQYNKNNNALATLRNLSQLLRLAALSFYKQEEVASLHGLAWLEFLDKTGQTMEFTQGAGKIFGTQVYQQKPDFELDTLFLLVKKWVTDCPQFS